jgi:outer membrane protein OmpA-like peptidoglycan-associated protein
VAEEPVVEPVVEEPAPEPQPAKQRHPLLRPNAEYQPYTPDMVLRRSEGAQTVLFQFNDSRLLREVQTRTGVYDNMPHLNTILDVTREALADETIVPVKIQIIGFASIDGGRWGNERLALERATAVKDYIRSKITSLPADLFELVVGGEAWPEFIDELAERQAAGTSGLTDEEYRQVADLLDTVQDFDEREKYLKAAAGGSIYAKLQQSFLSEQRSAVFVRIFYEEKSINK